MPLKTVAKALGLTVEEADSLLYIGNHYSEDVLEQSAPLFEEYVYAQGFESGSLGFYDWGGSARAKAGNGSTSDPDYVYEGKASAYVDAVSTAYAGFQGTPIVTDTAAGYDCSCWVKADDNYQANYVGFLFLVYSGTKAVKVVGANPTDKTVGTEWQQVRATLPSKELMNIEFDRIVPVVATKANNVTAENPAGGRVYIDNFTVQMHRNINENIQVEIVSESVDNWYVLGDSVTYSIRQPERLGNIKSVTQKIYDIDDQLVYEQTKTVGDAIREGFTYIPDDIGYYEAEFSGTSSDGSIYTLVCTYSKVINSVCYDIDLPRRSFVVVRSNAKPVEERNDYNWIVWGYRGDITEESAQRAVDIIDKIGFKGVRASALWGDTATNKNGFHKGPGQFDFTKTDLLYKYLSEKGFNIIWGFSSTPTWASDPSLPLTPNAATLYPGNVIAPAKWEYLEEGIIAFVERYKDSITGLQIWNEPYYGSSKTAYWYDTKENFEELTIRASKAAKSIKPDLEIWSAGFLSGTMGLVFCEDLLQNPEYVQAIDGITYHGSHSASFKYQDLMNRLGLDLPYANSEGYPYGYNSGNNAKGEKDYKTNNMYFVLDTVYAIKGNARSNTVFELEDNANAAERTLGVSSGSYGLFSDYPYFEPRQGAIIAYTLYDIMGKEFTYDAEYNLGDQKAVSFNNDGEKLLIVWNAKDQDFELSDVIKACMTDETVIMDYEGNIIETTALSKQKIYYISKLDEAKLAQVQKTPDEVINNDIIAPYYTCESRVLEPIRDIADLDVPRVKNTEEKPFDEKTFEISDNVQWNYSDWSWYGIGGAEKPENYAVKSSFHINEDGLYMLIDVEEPVFKNDGSYAAPVDMYQYDSVQFALDTAMTNDNNARIECQIGLTAEGELIYKQTAPDIGSSIPTEYTAQGQTMRKEHLRIERSGNHTVYKIFIPTGELYPYTYPGTVDYVRLSVLINENDGENRIGFYEWGSGIGTVKDVTKYGIIEFY